MQKPKLRPLDIRPIEHEGSPYLLLRDPQQLSDHQLIVPQPLATVMVFFDGRHTIPQMVEAFQHRYALELPAALVEELVAALDEAAMLENARAESRYSDVLNEYRQASHRMPALANRSYPGDPKELWPYLQEYLESADAVAPAPIDWSRPVGLLSPHIDYQRGGAVYAQIWKRAVLAAQEAELVILLGTDHYGSDLFTLTRQNYATPYGVLPTDTELVDRLAAQLGENAVYAGELRHRGEHSLELVAVWLHHMRAGRPVTMAPILVGSFQPYYTNGRRPLDDARIQNLLATLSEVAAERRTLIIASGDLAHVGPAFGGVALDGEARRVLRRADEELVAAMSAGDSIAFLDSIRREHDRNNICGVAPIFLTMQLLGDRPGEQVGYAVCPADELNTSVVTVTGMFFG